MYGTRSKRSVPSANIIQTPDLHQGQLCGPFPASRQQHYHSQRPKALKTSQNWPNRTFFDQNQQNSYKLVILTPELESTAAQFQIHSRIPIIGAIFHQKLAENASNTPPPESRVFNKIVYGTRSKRLVPSANIIKTPDLQQGQLCGTFPECPNNIPTPSGQKNPKPAKTGQIGHFSTKITKIIII